jgi:hypothetical protein
MKILSWLLGMAALAALAGCIRETSPTGTTEIRSPSLTDPIPRTSNNTDCAIYIWADPL